MRKLLRQLGHDSAYALLGLPLAIVAFSLVITGFSLGVGLLITLLGLPVLVATAYVARGFAELERVRIAPVLGRPRMRVAYRTGNQPGWRGLLAPLADIQFWLDLLHAVLRLPVSVATFTVVTTWWSLALAGLTRGLWDWTLPPEIAGQIGFVINDVGLPELLGVADDRDYRILVYTALGLVFALTLVPVVRACALVEAWLAHGLLNGIGGLRGEVEVAQARTVAAAEAEAGSLRRLERDIHDGPQQRLVRLAVDLGRARAQLDTDPAAARGTLDEALDQTRETLDELRTLSRGIAPPILTDRGLAAALQSLAGRSTVPVELEVTIPGPRPALVEQTAYFTVAEALTNVAKHSLATIVRVRVVDEAGTLVVTVTDDGDGGAHMAKGHGLAGLADRLLAAGGELTLSSPAGGPTQLRATIPHTAG